MVEGVQLQVPSLHFNLHALFSMFAIFQARQMFDNLERLLKLMDIDMTRGVKATLYVTNLDYLEVALKVCVEEF